MAITFDQVGSWSTPGTTTPYTVTRPTLVAGDVGVVRMFCICVVKNFTFTPTCSSNAGADAWTEILSFTDGSVASAADVGSVRVVVWYRDFPGTGDSNPSIETGGTAIRTGVVMTFRKGAGDTWSTPAALSAAITTWTNSSQTVTSSGTATVPDGAAVLAVAGIRNDTATFTRTADSIDDDGSPAVTWNGNYVEAPATHVTTTTGNDVAADAGYRLVTTGASGVNLTQEATLSAAETGAAVWIIQGITAPETHSGTATFTASGVATELGSKGALTAFGATASGVALGSGSKNGMLALLASAGGSALEAHSTARDLQEALTGGGVWTILTLGDELQPSTPIDELIAALVASGELVGISVSGVLAQPLPPAIVVRPDEPWRVPDRFCDDLQRYVAVVVVHAAAGADGVSRLYAISSAIIAALPEAFAFVSVGSPIIDESTGSAFLVAPVRVTYQNGST